MISLAVILPTLFICDRVRNTLLWSAKKDQWWLKLILDSIVSIELCTVALELGVVWEHYGFTWWMIGVYFNCLYQCMRWNEIKSPSPYGHIIDLISGKQSMPFTILRIGFVLASGIATYRLFISPVWHLEMSIMHAGRAIATSTKTCEVPWKATPTMQAFIAEFLGSMALTVGPKLVADNPTLQNNEPLVTAAIIAAMVTGVVVSALELSGGMFNPMLASVLVGGCSGHTLTEHVAIYWIGATLGAISGFKLYPLIRDNVYKRVTKPKNMEKKEN